MIAYRHVDPRFAFLREDSQQPAGRWNARGELTHYFCDTPDGAWAEFLRHEEIRDPADLATIRRAHWAADIGELPSHRPDLPQETLIGGPETWSPCQRAARQYREHTDAIAAPSAALKPGAARGWRVDGGSGPDLTGTGRSSRYSAHARMLSAGPSPSTATQVRTYLTRSDIFSRTIAAVNAHAVKRRRTDARRRKFCGFNSFGPATVASHLSKATSPILQERATSDANRIASCRQRTEPATATSRPEKVDFDLQLTLMASAMYRILARRAGNGYETAKSKTIFRKLVHASATIEIAEEEIVVTLGRRAYNPVLMAVGYPEFRETIPWLGNKALRIRFL